jgi:hypothetical protein
MNKSMATISMVDAPICDDRGLSKISNDTVVKVVDHQSTETSKKPRGIIRDKPVSKETSLTSLSVNSVSYDSPMVRKEANSFGFLVKKVCQQPKAVHAVGAPYQKEVIMDMAQQVTGVVPDLFGHMVAINLREQDMRSAWAKEHGLMGNDTVEWSNTRLMFVYELQTTIHETGRHVMDDILLIRLVPFMKEEGLNGTRVVWHDSDPVMNPNRKPPDKERHTQIPKEKETP